MSILMLGLYVKTSRPLYQGFPILKEEFFLSSTGCVRTENTGANKVARHSYPAFVGVTPPAPRLSRLPIVDGTSRVVAPEKLFGS
jgi:hypothetical protein